MYSIVNGCCRLVDEKCIIDDVKNRFIVSDKLYRYLGYEIIIEKTSDSEIIVAYRIFNKYCSVVAFPFRNLILKMLLKYNFGAGVIQWSRS